jgi:very-short-patch-repair endonuclease
MPSERRQFARALRKHATKAEDILWAQLRASRFHGAKFRRQTPFDRYVADFYCHAAKLAIELDGRQHDSELIASRIESAVTSALGLLGSSADTDGRAKHTPAQR